MSGNPTNQELAGSSSPVACGDEQTVPVRPNAVRFARKRRRPASAKYSNTMVG